MAVKKKVGILSLRSSIVNERMVPKILKKEIISTGKAKVIKKIRTRNDCADSLFIGYNADGNANNNIPSK
jgi:hypothetical protein